MNKFFKRLAAGLIGADVFLVIGIMAFALIKFVYILIKKDLLISKYNIAWVLGLFMILGFFYGIRSYHKRTLSSKLFRPSISSIALTLMTALVFALAGYLVLKEGFGSSISAVSFAAMTFLLILLMYPFSALITTYFSQKKTKKTPGRTMLTILFNPLFIIVFFWLFVIILYNSMYLPCGVSIMGVDNNEFTANTRDLGIQKGEKIVSIDDTQIKSLNDVKRFTDSLDTAKEVVLETDKGIYYIRTYAVDGEIYMGLLLSQAYCARQY